jgi:L-lactate permease
VVPLLTIRLLASWQEIRRNLAFIDLATAASVVPMFRLALVDDEFPSVVGGHPG